MADSSALHCGLDRKKLWEMTHLVIITHFSVASDYTPKILGWLENI